MQESVVLIDERRYYLDDIGHILVAIQAIVRCFGSVTADSNFQ